MASMGDADDEARRKRFREERELVANMTLPVEKFREIEERQRKANLVASIGIWLGLTMGPASCQELEEAIALDERERCRR